MDTYEKKYKEALEKARQNCAYPVNKPFVTTLEEIFPELAESEDEKNERIRLGLIEVLKTVPSGIFEDRGGITLDEGFYWLERKEYEKQGGQKPVEWSEEIQKEFERKYNEGRAVGIEIGKNEVQNSVEWSEKDKNLREATIGLLNLVQPHYAKSWGKSRIDCVDWLKSLRPQKHWKPSESEISILEGIVSGKCNPQNYQATLQNILVQLKAL